jgi:hypothetical protein
MASHKRNHYNFLDPDYQDSSKVNAAEERKVFNDFLNAMLDRIPNEGEPKSSYLYNSHMGNFVRLLDNAKDEYVKAKLAYHCHMGDSGKTDVEQKQAKTT